MRSFAQTAKFPTSKPPRPRCNHLFTHTARRGIGLGRERVAPLCGARRSPNAGWSLDSHLPAWLRRSRLTAAGLPQSYSRHHFARPRRPAKSIRHPNHSMDPAGSSEFARFFVLHPTLAAYMFARVRMAASPTSSASKCLVAARCAARSDPTAVRLAAARALSPGASRRKRQPPRSLQRLQPSYQHHGTLTVRLRLFGVTIVTMLVRRLPGGRGHTLAQRPPADSQKPHGERVKIRTSVRRPRGLRFGICDRVAGIDRS